MKISALWFLFTVNFQKTTNYADVCRCKPQCQRIRFASTVSSSGVSMNYAALMMIKIGKLAFDEVKCSSRLQDYTSMDAANRTWSEQLLRVTKLNETVHCMVLDAGTRLTEVETEWDEEFANEKCVVSAISLIGEAVTNYTLWERQTYYMNISYLGFGQSCDRKADSEIRLGHDIARGYGEMAKFTKSFREQIHLLENVMENLIWCN